MHLASVPALFFKLPCSLGCYGGLSPYFSCSFLNNTIKVQTITVKLNKWDHIKLKTDKQKTSAKQSTTWKSRLQSKRNCSRIINTKERIKIQNPIRNSHNVIAEMKHPKGKKEPKTWTNIWMANKYIKMCSPQVIWKMQIKSQRHATHTC